MAATDTLYYSDPASAGQYPPAHDSRYQHHPPATPTSGGGYHDQQPPSSARSSNFPYDSMSRQHQYTPGSSSASMAQTSPAAVPANEDDSHSRSGPTQLSPDSTNGHLPLDPAMSAVQSPTYPYPYPQQGHEMSHYAGSAPQNYSPWPGYGHPSMAYSSPGGPHSGVQSPASAGPRPSGQVSTGGRWEEQR